ncbi:MAG: hypothetical protein Q9221_007574 [Calogaya cf. arnoldii]
MADTPLGTLEGGQAILKEPLMLELSLKETESIQDVYIRIRDCFCGHGTPFSIFAKGVQHDKILQVFQGLARIHCPHLEDVRDPLGAAHYLGFWKIQIPSLETTDESDHDEDELPAQDEKVLLTIGLKIRAISNSSNQADVNLLLLLVGLLVLALVLYALTSSSLMGTAGEGLGTVFMVAHLIRGLGGDKTDTNDYHTGAKLNVGWR